MVINNSTPTADLRDAALAAFDFAATSPLPLARERLQRSSPQERDRAFSHLHAVAANLRRAAHTAATLSIRELITEQYPAARYLQLQQITVDPYYGFYPVAVLAEDGATLWASAPEIAETGEVDWASYLESACANLTHADGELDDPNGSPALRFDI
jgi:hypothetical protein